MKIIFLALVFLFPIRAGAEDQGKKTIVDYYRIAPDGMLGGMKYPLENKEGKWRAYSPRGNEISVTADVPSGYLEIVDAVTQEPIKKKLELLLVVSSKGERIIGVNLFSEDTARGLISGPGALFYHYTESRIDGCCWENVNSRIMRAPEIGDFLNPAFDISRFPGLNEIVVEADKEYGLFRYTLSKKGPGFSVSINLPLMEYLHAVGVKKERKSIQDFINNVRYREMRFQWNPVKGGFELKDKR